MKLKPEETELRGKWVFAGGKMDSDSTCNRIEFLISQDLKRVATDSSGWDILYMDPQDGRYWELTYPESHMHGGGPPTLTNLSMEQARNKYGI